MYLERIVAHKRNDPKFLQGREADWLSRAQSSIRPLKPFAESLRRGSRNGRAIIAEVKRASPSKGDFGYRGSVPERVKAYQAGGAAAVSILTEKAHFNGSLDDLKLAGRECALPLLRKDFLLEPWEIAQSAAWGADAVLLIAAILDDRQLSRMRKTAREYGLDTLLEVHDADELERALALPDPPEMIGINNRDLETFTVDLTLSQRLARLIPEGIVKVSESGFGTEGDLARLDGLVDAFLIGETLMRSSHPEQILQTWTARS